MFSVKWCHICFSSNEKRITSYYRHGLSYAVSPENKHRLLDERKDLLLTSFLLLRHKSFVTGLKGLMLVKTYLLQERLAP